MEINTHDTHDPLPVLHVTSSRAAAAWVKTVRHETNVRIAFNLKNKGFGNQGIAKAMDLPENSVRLLLEEAERR
jgi:hypothetical protein